MIFGAVIEKTYRGNKEEFVPNWIEITEDGRSFLSMEYTGDEDFISNGAITPIIVKKLVKKIDFTDDAGASIYENFTIVSFDLQIRNQDLSHEFGVFNFYEEGLRYELELLDENGKTTNDMSHFCQFNMSNFKVVGNILDGMHKEAHDGYGVKYYVEKTDYDDEIMSL